MMALMTWLFNEVGLGWLACFTDRGGGGGFARAVTRVACLHACACMAWLVRE